MAGELGGSITGDIAKELGIIAGVIKREPENIRDALAATAVQCAGATAGALGTSAILRHFGWDLPAAASDAVAIVNGVGAAVCGIAAAVVPPIPVPATAPAFAPSALEHLVNSLKAILEQ